jgi:hypothetical protein
MDARERAGKGVPPPAAGHPAWLLALAALWAWQAYLTLGLFGPERPWDALLDDRPVLSGRHPLHLYHGYLGARALRERGSPSCYDPAFHAGYPKTPVFDSGSRPAELALALAGGRYSPAAYKLAHALLCLAAPGLLFAAARGVGLGRGPACLACALGLLVWWGQPCRDALEAGEVDLLLATLLVLAQAGLLLYYHHSPGPLGLLGVVATAFLGWFAHPLLLLLLSPLFLIYYLSVGTRHRLAWHASLWGGLVLAVAANAFWLVDWVSYWWIRVPLQVDVPVLTHRTFRTLWEAPLWGGPVDRGLACFLAGAGGAGVLLFNENSRRAAARLLGLAWAGFLGLAVLGIAWEPAGRLGVARLLVPALLFAAVPAAHAVEGAVGLAARGCRTRWASLALPLAALGGLWLACPGPLAEWSGRLWRPTPLALGLGPEREALVEAVREHTDDTARVLWQDRPGAHWTALLPLLTGRSFIGGLGPDAGIEHAACGLVEETLAGRPAAHWSDAELRDYCERYNVGWVVCWPGEAQRRLAAWAAVTPLPLPGGDGACLLTVPRPHSYTLRGAAQWLAADAHRVVLADVVPQRSGLGDGQVWLSLHYHAGMRVAPGRVRLERVELVGDSIPFVRLRVSEPVPRVTITWDRR